MNNPVLYILLLPLAGAAINALAGWKLPRRAVEVIACLSVAASFACSVWAYASTAGPEEVAVYGWLSFAWLPAPASLRLDALSGTMAMMVTGVSALIHVYSVGYMEDEEGHARYYTLLNLFVFMMLLLVLAGSLPLMFVGWEGVGFCSYALIGFWYKKPENAAAGMKAFIVTRIGDVGFGVALVWLFYLTGTTAISEINSSASAIPVATATALGLLLLLGAAGKSAQLPLTVWLPDAMAGPTPVSALIHAATMVTAGVYLLMRLFPVISRSPDALAVIASVGAVTAFYAATAATSQSDIKKVLAYSTISQIGLMVLGVGAGAVDGALFHLFTHAFFKALLFMGAGCVIHALHGEQDIFRMGGLWRRMPLVSACFVAGALALAAAPLTGGFFSKEVILAAAFGTGTPLYYFLWALAELTSLLTAYYIFRLVFLVFAGERRREPHPVSASMQYTLVPLALMAVGGGIINLPGWAGGDGWLSDELAGHGLIVPAHEAHGAGLVIATVGVAAAGFLAAWYLYAHRPAKRGALVGRYNALIDFFRAAWYLDAAYNTVLVEPFKRAAGHVWHGVDEGGIDGAISRAGELFQGAGTYLRGMVTGRATTYITATAIGAAAILAYFAWSVIHVS